MKQFKTKNWINLLCLSGVLILIYSRLNSTYFIANLIAQFTLWNCLLFAVFILFFRKKINSILLYTSVLLIVGFPFLNFISKPASPNTTKETTVVFANILSSNNQLQTFIESSTFKNTPIIGCIELSPEQEKKLTSTKKNVISKSLNNNFGIALLTDLPVTQSTIHHFTSKNYPFIEADIMLNNQLIKFFVVHLPPPIFKENFDLHKSYLDHISHLITRSTIPVVVMGDYNSTFYSNHFINFVKKSQLSVAKNGILLPLSFPKKIPLLAIDHVFTTSTIQVDNINTLIIEGSDHLGMQFKLKY